MCGMNSELKLFLPQSFIKNCLCYFISNYPEPSIIICTDNGNVFEFKNKKPKFKIDIGEKSLRVCNCHFIKNNEIFTVFFILTCSNKLLLIKNMDKMSKIYKTFYNINEFSIFDFKNLGFPQLKLNFLNSFEREVVDVMQSEVEISQVPETDTEDKNTSENSSDISQMLIGTLETVKINVEELKIECIQLDKLCGKSEKFILPKWKLKVEKWWWKIFSEHIVLGMVIHNTWFKELKNIKLVLICKNFKNYRYKFYSCSDLHSVDSIQPLSEHPTLYPNKEILVVGVFQVPVFYDSIISVTVDFTTSDSDDLLFRKKFCFEALDIVISSMDIDKELNAVELITIMAVKKEIRIKVESPIQSLITDFIDLLESLLVGKMGFQKLKNMNINNKNIKVFYCTSKFFKETIIMSNQVSRNPDKWNLKIFISNEAVLYVLVNTLYDLLPEGTTILMNKNER